jgi:hypothetical protein
MYSLKSINSFLVKPSLAHSGTVGRGGSPVPPYPPPPQPPYFSE